MRTSAALAALAVALCASLAAASPLWDYVHTYDPHYSCVGSRFPAPRVARPPRPAWVPSNSRPAPSSRRVRVAAAPPCPPCASDTSPCAGRYFDTGARIGGTGYGWTYVGVGNVGLKDSKGSRRLLFARLSLSLRVCVCVRCFRSGYVLNMTSQQWRDASEVSISIWTHQLVVIVPDNIRFNTSAGLYVTGNSNNNPGVPSATDEDILVSAILATSNGLVTATLFQIPNAPIVFANDPSVRWSRHY